MVDSILGTINRPMPTCKVSKSSLTLPVMNGHNGSTQSWHHSCYSGDWCWLVLCLLVQLFHLTSVLAPYKVYFCLWATPVYLKLSYAASCYHSLNSTIPKCTGSIKGGAFEVHGGLCPHLEYSSAVITLTPVFVYRITSNNPYTLLIHTPYFSRNRW